jgi:hypothetical protein
VGPAGLGRVQPAVAGAVGRAGDGGRHGAVDRGVPGHRLPPGARPVHQPGQQGAAIMHRLPAPLRSLATCWCWVHGVVGSNMPAHCCCLASPSLFLVALQDMSDYGQMDWAYYAVGHQVSRRSEGLLC